MRKKLKNNALLFVVITAAALYVGGSLTPAQEHAKVKSEAWPEFFAKPTSRQGECALILTGHSAF
jgi:hypothetical protein